MGWITDKLRGYEEESLHCDECGHDFVDHKDLHSHRLDDGCAFLQYVDNGGSPSEFDDWGADEDSDHDEEDQEDADDYDGW